MLAVGPAVAQLRVEIRRRFASAFVGRSVRSMLPAPVPVPHPEFDNYADQRSTALESPRARLVPGFRAGGFADCALIHENQLSVVPKEMPFAQAALLSCAS